jgi:hypothetical protein
MFVKIPYFLKQRSLTRRSKEGRRPEKKEHSGPAEEFEYLRSRNASKRKIRRIAGPSFVKACSYQSTERAAITDEEVRARRGTTRKANPQIMVNAESIEALP